MTKAHVYKLDLKTLSEPDDLWGKLFLTGLKAHSEENDMSFQMLAALKEAVVQLDKAVSELLPEKPDDLRAAMETIQNVEEAWKQQSIRRLDNVERAAVIAKQIIASQKSK